MIQTTSPVYDTERYSVIQIDPIMVETDQGVDILNYHVLNRSTGAVEGRTETLPQAIYAAQQFNAAVAQLTANPAVVEAPVQH